MSLLLLNPEVAQFNAVVDRRILDTLTDYCVQYGPIPERLYLTNPTLAVHIAIVIVDVSQRDTLGPTRPVINLAFYHPEHLSPLYIQTCREFNHVYSAHSDDAEWSEFLIDGEPEFEDDFPEDYFERLLKAYPSFSRISDSMAKARIRHFTFPIQSLNLA